MRITAILTCFNRRELTIKCLERWFGQVVSSDVSLDAVVVDDGSSDGTIEGVRRLFPCVNLIMGNGSLFWCGGMRVAWNAAALDDPDYYCLINDDTVLDSFALQTMLEVASSPGDQRIVVGAIRDPKTGAATYGGWNRVTGLNSPTGAVEKCDTFNGNCVLVTRAVYKNMGVFSDSFTHGMGDMDYGYQAAKRGIEILQTAEFVGACARNGLEGSWRDRSLSCAERFKKLQSPKGHPWKEWVTYHRRNSGWRWPIYCISPIVRILTGR